MPFTMQQLILWLIAMNVLTLFLVWFDKSQAKRRGWRIPEKTLLLGALLGGSPALLIGMRLFRHKTVKWSFQMKALAMLLVQLCAGMMLFIA